MAPIQEKVIMYDAPEAARPVVMFADGKEISTGFLSIDNRFFNDEGMARYQSCTHKTCECGSIMSKSYTSCETCRSKKRRERYFQMPLQDWDGKTFIAIYGEDHFFQNAEALESYCEEHAVRAEDLMLVICTPNRLWQVTSEHWSDVGPEDVDDFLPKDVVEQLNKLNEVIAASGPVSWSEGKIRTAYEYMPESLNDQPTD